MAHDTDAGQGAPAEDVGPSAVAQRHHQQLGAVENALDLQRQEFFFPCSQGFGGE